jgi:hypothetical protein
MDCNANPHAGLDKHFCRQRKDQGVGKAAFWWAGYQTLTDPISQVDKETTVTSKGLAGGHSITPGGAYCLFLVSLMVIVTALPHSCRSRLKCHLCY